MSAAHALTLEKGRYKYEKGGSLWGVVCVCACARARARREGGEEKGEILPSTEKD